MVTPAEKIDLFLNLFRCREDVYPQVWQNTKTGKIGSNRIRMFRISAMSTRRSCSFHSALPDWQGEINVIEFFSIQSEVKYAEHSRNHT